MLIDDPFKTSGAADGKAIKACDQFAAYIEAHVSECYGISSKALSSGKKELRGRLLASDASIDIKELMDRLDEMEI
jgi:putative hydrolase of HD superfamily